MTKTPCKDCVDDRTWNCHSICERYIEWVTLHEKEKQKINDERDRLYQPQTKGLERGVKEFRKRKWR